MVLQAWLKNACNRLAGADSFEPELASESKLRGRGSLAYTLQAADGWR